MFLLQGPKSEREASPTAASSPLPCGTLEVHTGPAGPATPAEAALGLGAEDWDLLRFDSTDTDESALSWAHAPVPEDTIRGERLGERVVGRKSRFAGFDRRPHSAVHATIDGAMADPSGGSALSPGAAVEAMDGFVCGVEELVLQHYAQEEEGGWHGVHCEGACFLTLFGLLMWDVIFAPVPGTFPAIPSCSQHTVLNRDQHNGLSILALLRTNV